MELFIATAIAIALIVHIGTIALVLWAGYRLARAAVRDGILDADARRAGARSGA